MQDCLSQDHPRVCGEQPILAYPNWHFLGSPPRVRGTGYLWRIFFCLCRITPACAGNRISHHYTHVRLRDHPRVCGEQTYFSRPFGQEKGSPPRVRGTVRLSSGQLVQLGITPACAGNRSTGSTSGQGNGDHPRVCGEQNSLRYYRIALAGSPPRVRGTVREHRASEMYRRITPACAGNSLAHHL